MIKDRCKYCKKVCIRTKNEMRYICDNIKCDREHLQFLFEEWRKGNLDNYTLKKGAWK